MQNSNISLTMHIMQNEERSTTSYDTSADFLEKDGEFSLLFDEKNYDDGEVTKCRLEISDDSLRMRRNGPIVMEQTHVKDQETKGYIKTPFGRVETELRTFRFSFTQQVDGSYHLELAYDLYTDNERTGTYLLEITITKKEEMLS